MNIKIECECCEPAPLSAEEQQRLAFVRWSRLGGYAQFSEWTTSDDPVIETRWEQD